MRLSLLAHQCTCVSLGVHLYAVPVISNTGVAVHWPALLQCMHMPPATVSAPHQSCQWLQLESDHQPSCHVHVQHPRASTVVKEDTTCVTAPASRYAVEVCSSVASDCTFAVASITHRSLIEHHCVACCHVCASHHVSFKGVGMAVMW